MGWQRKGSGKAYKSRSGYNGLIGTECEKILNYGIWISNDKQFEMNKVTGQVREHDCRINWVGSSKQLESDLAVDVLLKGTTQKPCISTIIIDEDTTKMVKIKKIVPHEVTKESDINHAKKTAGNDSYALQKKHHIL